ncbi:MAG TPA: PAS domain-containing protein [Gemmatimonadales bacterium]|nr:PAS domain-containing protein [Gemmatimonadales bacterium]
MLRYGVAIVSVGVALLLMHGLELLSVADARPALLVAVAVSALYGGLGPGLAALALASLVSRDPGVLVAGALLAGVCALSRRPAAEKPIGNPTEPEKRAAPAFVEVTTEATWRFHHEQPLDITMTEDDQVEHLYLYSVLAECNDAFARMYGFQSAADVIGTRLVVFLPPSNPENIAYLRSFIRSGYRLEDAKSREIDRYGNAKCFVNNLVGIFERGQLVGAWGTQRDVTEEKPAGGTQENRSRIHSTKSSSQ